MNSNMKWSLVTLVLVLMGGCASNPVKPAEEFNDEDQRIATDFVNAITNLRGYAPLSTTVQFRHPVSEFSTSLLNIMTERGYGVQLLPEGTPGKQLIVYTSQRFNSSERTSVAYEVTVGDIKLSREYEIRAGRPYPLTALSVLGSQSQPARTVDNTIFSDSQYSETSSATQPELAESEAIQNDDALVITDLGSDHNFIGVPSNHEPNKREFEESNDLSPIGTRGNRARRNIAELGKSNYSELFDGYTTVRSDTLVFANDSLALGVKNKNIIKNIADSFTPETDVISVIGCSHGTTNIANGNAVLANGRANRVREEFIFASIDPSKVLDEGCWAVEKFNQMPARGVVVTLRTRVEQN